MCWAVSGERGSCARTAPPCPWEVSAVGGRPTSVRKHGRPLAQSGRVALAIPAESSPCSTVGKPAGVAMGNGSKGAVFFCFWDGEARPRDTAGSVQAL